MNPQAVLIDLDGTLADSEPLKGRALAATCQEYGGTVAPERYIDVMGEDWPTVTHHFFRNGHINPPVDEFNARFRVRYLQLLEEHVTPTRGAWDFIVALKKAGIKVAVVSSAAPWMVDKVLVKLGMKDLFDLVITQAHVTKHKPDPEAYVLALSLLGVGPETVIVFEDSSAGLQAAAKAGCMSIAIRHRFNVRHDMNLAHETIADFCDPAIGRRFGIWPGSSELPHWSGTAPE